jgi:glutaconate CoA-transferase, subunit A
VPGGDPVPFPAPARVTYRTVGGTLERCDGHGRARVPTVGGLPIDKVRDVTSALEAVQDGCRLGVGGILLQRKPLAALLELVERGARGLHFYSFLGSLDAEILAAYGALEEAHVGYVGFEQLGVAPAFEAGVREGAIAVREYTEYLFVSGLRAAMAGLPFLPTKGGTGSQVLEDLGLTTVTCPYTGVELVAAPAIELDVALIHAEVADADGNVLGPTDRSFLFDFDANLARAADHVIVTVERVAERDEVRRNNHRTLLYGFEVDAVVPLPGGAAPTGLTAEQGADVGALARYLAAVGDGTEPRTACRQLVAGGAT